MNTIPRDILQKITEYVDFSDNLRLSSTCNFFKRNIDLEKVVLRGNFTEIDNKIANYFIKKIIKSKNWVLVLKTLPFVTQIGCLSFRLFRYLSLEESIQLALIVEKKPYLVSENLDNPEMLWKIYFYIAREIVGFNLDFFKYCIKQCRLRGLDYLLIEDNFLIDEEDFEYRDCLLSCFIIV